VWSKVAELFPPEDRGGVLEILGEYGKEPYELDQDRVHLAILKLSGGDLAILPELVRDAKSDYRNVLAWAEYPQQMRGGPLEKDPEALSRFEAADRRQYLQWLHGERRADSEPGCEAEAPWAAWDAVQVDAWAGAASAAEQAATAATILGRVEEDERRIQCDLLRDIFINPFHAVAFDTFWQTPQVVALADSIYGGRAFDQLLRLAEALEEAGCTNADILAHCRAPGPHVRGCWVVDLLLGKD
jgi:hypothetical protein